jgi:hypothetical protein
MIDNGESNGITGAFGGQVNTGANLGVLAGLNVSGRIGTLFSNSMAQAPQYIQVAVGESTQTATFGATVKPGRAIVVILANQNSTGVTFNTVTDTQGNTYVACPGASVSSTPNSTQMAVYVAFNVVGGASNAVSFTATGSMTSPAIYCFEVAGITAYDNGAGATGTTANATTGPFNLAHRQCIVFAATINTGSATGAGGGFRLIQKTSGYADILEYAVFGAAGSVTAIATMTAQTWGIVAAGFYAAQDESVINALEASAAPTTDVMLLPPFQAIPTGHNNGITGAFGGQVAPGPFTPPPPLTIGYEIDNIFLPPVVPDLPPFQTLQHANQTGITGAFGGQTTLGVPSNIFSLLNVTGNLGTMVLSGTPVSVPAVTFKQGAYLEEPGGSVASPATTAAFGSANTAGNAIVVFVMCGMVYPANGFPGTGVTDTQGNSYTQVLSWAGTASSGYSAVSMAVYVAFGITGGSGNQVSVAFTTTNVNAMTVIAAEYSGINAYDTGAAMDTSTNSLFTSTPSTGNFTTSKLGAIIATGWSGSQPTTTPGSGYTQRLVTSIFDQIIEDDIGATIGTNSAGVTLAGNASWGMIAANFYWNNPSAIQSSVYNRLRPAPADLPSLTAVQLADGGTFEPTTGGALSGGSFQPIYGGLNVTGAVGTLTQQLGLGYANPTFIQKAPVAGVAYTAVTSVTAILPVAATVGNTVIVAWSGQYPSSFVSVTDDKGNSYYPALTTFDDASTYETGVYYSKITIAGATHITVTYTTGGMQSFYVWALEYSGLAGPDVSVDTYTGSSGTSFTTGPTPTTTQATELLFNWLAWAGNNLSALDPTWTSRGLGGNGPWNGVADRVVTSTGAYSSTSTIASSGGSVVSCIVTFKAQSFAGLSNINTITRPSVSESPQLPATTGVKAGYGQSPGVAYVSHSSPFKAPEVLPYSIALHAGAGSIVPAKGTIYASPLDVLSPAMQPWGLPPTQQTILKGLDVVTLTGYLNISGQFGSLSIAGNPGITAPTYVQVASNNVAPGTSVTATFTGSNTAGNLLVAAVFSPTGGPISVTDTAGNVYHSAVVSPGGIVAIYYAWNIAAHASNAVTATWGGSNYYELSVVEYSGVQNTSDPLDVATAIGTTASTSVSVPITTTVGTDLLFTVIETNGSSTGYVPTGGAITRYNFNSGAAMEQDQLAGAPGTYSPGCTFTSSYNWSAAVAAFKPLGLATTINLNAQEQIFNQIRADLPPFQALENGEPNGITGAFGGQTNTGYGQPGPPPSPITLYSELDIDAEALRGRGKPPHVYISDGGSFNPTSGGALGQGAGQAAQPPVITFTEFDIEAPAERYRTKPPTVYISDGGTFNATSGGALGQGANPLVGYVYGNSFLPPLVADLPLFQAIENGEPIGITGAFGGQTNTGAGQPSQNAQLVQPFVIPPSAILPPLDAVLTGYGQPSQNASLVQPVVLPPSAVLPPTDYVLAGYGQPAEAPFFVQPFVLPPNAQLPPTDYVLAGYGQPPQNAALYQPFNLPQLALLPPTDYVLKGYGQPSQTAQIIPAVPPPFVPLLPPTDYVYAGFGQAAQAPATFVGTPPPFVPLLPPTDYVYAGYGQPAQNAQLVQPFVLPPNASLPPLDSVYAGYGQPSQAPFFVQPTILPPSAQLPPTDYVFAGFGFPTQAAQIIPAIPPPVVPALPPPTSVYAGFGQAAQAAATFIGVPAPSAILPPTDYIYTGFGQAAQVPFIVPAQIPPSATLPPLDSIFAGYGQPSQVAQLLVQPPAPYVQLPPQDYILKGFGQATQAPSVVPAQIPPFAVLPPEDSIFIGYGQPAQVAQILPAIPPPRVPDLPPPQSIFAGFGQPAQNAALFQPFVLPPSALLPPPTFLVAGYGKPSLNAFTISQPLVAPSATLPPQDYVVTGYGQAAQIAEVFYPSLFPAPSAILPPEDSIFAGYGTPSLSNIPFTLQPQPPYVALPPEDSIFAGFGKPAQVAVQIIGVPPPAANLPPQDYVYAGYGQAAQAPFFVQPFVLPPSAALPPPQSIYAGYGKPAQVAALFQPFVLPPSAALPPLDSIFAGYGQAAEVPFFVQPTLLPPSANLPPQDYVFAGYGQAAEAPFHVQATILPPTEVLPPQDYIYAGYGKPAEAPFFVQPTLLPPSAVLPPEDSIFAGFGYPPQNPAIYTQPLVPPFAALPPTDYILKGFGQAAQAPTLVQPFVLPPTEVLPPPQSIYAGFGRPAQNAALYQPFVLPPSAALPPLDSIFAGFGFPPQKAVVYTQPLVPPFTQLPPEDAVFAGHGQAAQSPELFQPFVLPPSAQLPPQDYVLKGYGQAAQNAQIIIAPPVAPHAYYLIPPPLLLSSGDPPPAFYATSGGALTGGAGTAAQSAVVFSLPPPSPYVQLPPTDYLFAGYGQAAQAPFISKAAPADYVPLPPLDSLFAGFGQAAQNPAIYIGVPAPAALLPPTDYVLAGYGQAAQVAQIIPAVPPPLVPDLPPPQYVIPGFGFPAQVAQLFQAYDARAPYPTVIPELVVGYGQAAQAPQIIPTIPAPLVPDLPPPQYLFAGFGFPPQNAQIIPAALPPVADLPPQDSIFAGYGVPSQNAFIYVQPPAQYVSLPPISAIIAGYNYQAPVLPPILRTRTTSRLVAFPYWATFFEPHHLPLYVYEKDDDKRRHPVEPYKVTFALYQVKDMFLMPVGPDAREPAHGPGVGHFYVTGVVGEGGQPGIWMVRWTVQETFFSQSFTKDYYFEVLDAVSAHFPDDKTPRGRKRGWD